MKNINLLKRLYQINSKSGQEQEIVEFIVEYITTNYPSVKIHVDSSNNIYCVKGKTDMYPCVVGHTDQVGSYKGKISIFRQHNIIIGVGEHGKQVNLGADDKNGVWIALELLRTEPCLKVALFTGEEIGCRGSRVADLSFFDDVKFVIQCDRKHKSDFIYMAGAVKLCDQNWPSKELKDKYGYVNTYGLMTDVQELKKRGLKVACCNVSCGYYNPHLDTEYTNIEELINCLNFVREIIQTTPYTPHEYKPGSSYYYGHHYSDDYDDVNWNEYYDESTGYYWRGMYR
jgi:putative aminopeptidase FrvX